MLNIIYYIDWKLKIVLNGFRIKLFEDITIALIVRDFDAWRAAGERVSDFETSESCRPHMAWHEITRILEKTCRISEALSTPK